MRYLISYFIFSVYLYGFNYHLKPYKISDGIDCFFGLPSQVDKTNGGNMVNSCYIETSEGYIVIDSGPTYSYAQEAYAVMKKKKKLPVKYVINTSWDEVHVLGNEFYKELGAKILGPKGYREHIENKNVLTLASKLSKDAFINTRIVPLDEYIQEDKTLVFKNMKIEIKTLEDDMNYLYVYIEDKNIVFAGDLVFNNRLPPLNNGRSLLTWLKGLDKLSALEWEDIISAHGYMTRRSALKNTKSYLSLLKKEVLKRVKDGKSKETVLEQVKLVDFKENKFYEIWHHKNVLRAYDELKIFSNQKKNSTKDNNLTLQIKKELKELKKQEIKKVELSGLKSVKIIKLKAEEKKETDLKVENVKYKSFDEAMHSAKMKNKIVLIKVRSTICKYCDQLDRIIDTNLKVQKILNKYFELVEINMDDQELPLELMVLTTPTLIFIRPEESEVLMQLVGIRALGELLIVLNEAVEDGHNGGYLKP